MSNMSLDGEPHAETTFLSQSFEHGEAPRSEKQLVVDMFAKSGFGTQQIRSQVQKHEKHTFESEA